MAKISSASSRRGTQLKKNAKSIPDSKIDFSDIPALTDKQLKRTKRLGRPLIGDLPRQLIAIRVDSQVLDLLKQEAKDSGMGYQSLINEILYRHSKRSAA